MLIFSRETSQFADISVREIFDICHIGPPFFPFQCRTNEFRNTNNKTVGKLEKLGAQVIIVFVV